jgi:hypothetical protein
MNHSLRRLMARKQVLLAELQLQRMQLALHAGDVREALRPAGLIGGALARPAAAVALVDSIAPLLGLHRLARLVRLGAIAVAAYRIARVLRARDRGPA